MHTEAMRFVMRMKCMFPDYFKGGIVLDIGSADINGSVRHLFKKSKYIGVDIWPGKNVDIVMNAHDLNLKAKTVISCECLEHCVDWKEVVQNCLRLASRCVIITCASTGRAEHGTKETSPECSPATTDYYRNITIEDIAPLVKELPFKLLAYNPDSHDLYFIGFKEWPVYKPSLVKYIYLECKAFFWLRVKDWRNGMRKIKPSVKRAIKSSWLS